MNVTMNGQKSPIAISTKGVAIVFVISVLGLLALWHFETSRPRGTADATNPLHIKTIHPKRATVARHLQTNATLEAFEDADLFAKVSGYLSDVRVDIGDHVKAGQILAVIDVPEMEKELAEAQAQLEAKQKALDTAQWQVKHNKADLRLQEVTLRRQATLNAKQWVSDQALDEISAKAAVAQADLGLAESNRDLATAEVVAAAATVEKQKALLAYSRIKAPFDGVVAQRLVNRGDLVQAPTASRTSPLFKVQRIDVIRVFCDIPEDAVANIRVGDKAVIKPIGMSGAAIRGAITRIAFRLDPETRNMRTEIDVPNPDERLFPGMYAEVSLEMDRRSNVLTVPTSAVGTDSYGAFVYVVKDGRIERLPIEIGLSDGNRVEVVGGLSEEATIVATAKAAPPPGTAIDLATTSQSMSQSIQ